MKEIKHQSRKCKNKIEMCYKKNNKYFEIMGNPIFYDVYYNYSNYNVYFNYSFIKLFLSYIRL